MYEEQVQRGAKLLDKTNPGWVDRIDIDKLELSTCETCVLGQLCGEEDTRRIIGYYRSGCNDNGFALPDEAYDCWPSLRLGYLQSAIAIHAPLTAAWKAEIGRRRAIAKMMSDVAEAVSA